MVMDERATDLVSKLAGVVPEEVLLLKAHAALFVVMVDFMEVKFEMTEIYQTTMGEKVIVQL
jgi:hypothetical protein